MRFVCRNDQKDGTECLLSNSPRIQELGEVLYKLKGIFAIQRYLKWLEKWPDRNLAKFHKGKVLCLCWRHIVHCWNNRLGANQMENSFAEKFLGSKLNKSQKHDLAAETTTHWSVLAKV